jgi:hypothetical protein
MSATGQKQPQADAAPMRGASYLTARAAPTPLKRAVAPNVDLWKPLGVVRRLRHVSPIRRCGVMTRNLRL